MDTRPTLNPVTDWSWETSDGALYVERTPTGNYVVYRYGDSCATHSSLASAAKALGCDIGTLPHD